MPRFGIMLKIFSHTVLMNNARSSIQSAVSRILYIYTYSDADDTLY